jgi:peptidoglycan/xylan/chitin deacetylase (PgdA/CDA1 family)
VGRGMDRQPDVSCDNRIALTFDDGTSSYRPKLLRLLRDKQVHATFFDNGVRVEANPQIARFEAREGHVVLNHTYLHVHMDELTPAANREEVLHNERVLAAAGAPITFKGIRPPFGGSNPEVQRLLLEMGYTYFLNRIDAEDWLPEKSAAAIRDDILAQLHPGVIIGLHDGPIDTTAGAATVEAVGQIIDRARELGYCFGVVDATGQVIADRYVSSGAPIPQIVNPVPYHLPLAFGVPAQIPQPAVRIPSPLQIRASHSPARFTRGGTGTLRVVVANRSRTPGDGSPLSVTSAVPAGLTVTGASGRGWTCTVDDTVTCTRSDNLAPGHAFPPISVAVRVAAAAPGVIVHAPALVAHGESWTDEASDAIAVR